MNSAYTSVSWIEYIKIPYTNILHQMSSVFIVYKWTKKGQAKNEMAKTQNRRIFHSSILLYILKFNLLLNVTRIMKCVQHFSFVSCRCSHFVLSDFSYYFFDIFLQLINFFLFVPYCYLCFDFEHAKQDNQITWTCDFK